MSEISEDEHIVIGEEIVRSPDVTVVEIEILVDCVDSEYHLENEPF